MVLGKILGEGYLRGLGVVGIVIVEGEHIAVTDGEQDSFIGLLRVCDKECMSSKMHKPGKGTAVILSLLAKRRDAGQPWRVSDYLSLINN
jgi:hypothetical protein